MSSTPDLAIVTEPGVDSGPTTGAAVPMHAMDNACAAVLSLLAALDRAPTTIKVHTEGVDLELSWAAPVVSAAPALPVPSTPAPPVLVAVESPAGHSSLEAAAGLDHIHAPTVGVFYRRPDPSSPPFVAEGDVVTPGQQLGIVEAMKLMIPVVSDRSGRIGSILKADGSPTEYGEPLFTLAPTDG